MHEVAVATALLDLIRTTAPPEEVPRVLRARIELGELACVDPETLGFAFDVATRGTHAEGCELVFDRRPARVVCAVCGWEGRFSGGGCGACGAASVELTSGRELRLVSIDVEDSDDA